MRRMVFLTLVTLAACTSPRLTLGTPTSTAALSLATPSAGAGTVAVIGGDEAGLRDFIARWFSPGAYGPAGGDTTIWIGQLPDTPPLSVPIPPGARVIGSMQGPYTALEAMLTVDQPFVDVREFYRSSLTADGWTTPENPSQGGFVDIPIQSDSYCLASKDAYLTVSGQDRQGQPADVRLSLTMPAEFTPCDSPSAGQPLDAFALIPVLSPPPGAVMRDSSAGSGGNYAEASANLETSILPADLMSHFSDLLAKAGWESLSSASTDTFAWSTWTLTDSHAKEWNGMLLIVATPFASGENERYALVRVTEKR